MHFKHLDNRLFLFNKDFSRIFPTKFSEEFQNVNIVPVYYKRNISEYKVHSIQTGILIIRVENKSFHTHKKVNNANLFTLLTNVHFYLKRTQMSIP